DFVILLSHNPDYAERLITRDIDLMLSGHTHGGQVTLFGLWAAAVPSAYGQKYRGGFVRTEHTLVYVTTGVGTITPPVRFWARPEVVLITLERR
ncbi:MAG: metallophosphoesterase, partial [Anaerolineae bacterium]